MMDNVHETENKDLKATAEPAEAEQNDAATALGKFKSVDALMSAYRNLEAEFTRRSQRLKELEEASKAQSVPAEGAPSQEKPTEADLLKAALSSESVRQAVVEEYLKTVATNKGVPLISGGVAAPAPRSAPKTVKEAGALAQRFLKG